eukprot:gene356-989_t
MADKATQGVLLSNDDEKSKFVDVNRDENTDMSGSGSVNRVTDWVRRSVLFWNKQDTLSIDECSSDVQENGCDSDNKVDENSINNPDQTSGTNEPIQGINLASTCGEKSSLLNEELILDVEKIQRLCIDPFILETGPEKGIFSEERQSNESPYYTLNFPKYAQHMYSPLYEENSASSKGNCHESVSEKTDWNIADTLNKLSQTWIQIDSNVDFEKHNENTDRKESGYLTTDCGVNSEKMESKQRNYNVDVLNSIKRVQETLSEIADELENTRTRKTSKDFRDPKLILINLLSRIQPPVNRDSFPGSLGEETSHNNSQEGVDRTKKVVNKTSVTFASEMEKMASNPSVENKVKTNEDFDVIKELSDPDKSTESVLEQFMFKLSTAEKPSSTIRGLLRRISEEITGDTPDENAQDRKVEEVNILPPQMLNLQPLGLNERRASSLSGQSSSIPTSPNTFNYDSGFGEHTKTNMAITKDSKLSTASIESKELDLVKESRENSQKDQDSETSTDWSPYSTLSVGESSFRPARNTSFQSSSVRRSSGRRRSTGAVNSNSRPSSKIIMGSGSCPSFDARCASPGNTPANMGPGIRYSKSEVEAIRKFLSLTSVYFGSRGASTDLGIPSYDELMEKEDIEKIHELLQKQREDLDKQRHQQEDLLRRLGEMLLQLVTLKEDHLQSTQKQTKALSLLKKQLDNQKKEHIKEQETVKERMKSLEVQLQSQMKFIEDQSHNQAETLPSVVTVDTPKIGATLNDDVSNGHIVWKLGGITRKLTRVHAGVSEGVLVSEPFYSGNFGYKMTVWLYLNGRGDFKGKGMSIYVCPLSGEYDAILPWPIRPVYTFTLIDQNADVMNRHDHTKTRRTPDITRKGGSQSPTRGGIHRPQNGAKSLIIGFDDFISQAELSQGSYIVDDTLFLKVQAQIRT